MFTATLGSRILLRASRVASRNQELRYAVDGVGFCLGSRDGHSPIVSAQKWHQIFAVPPVTARGTVEGLTSKAHFVQGAPLVVPLSVSDPTRNLYVPILDSFVSYRTLTINSLWAGDIGPEKSKAPREPPKMVFHIRDCTSNKKTLAWKPLQGRTSRLWTLLHQVVVKP